MRTCICVHAYVCIYACVFILAAHAMHVCVHTLSFLIYTCAISFHSNVVRKQSDMRDAFTCTV